MLALVAVVAGLVALGIGISAQESAPTPTDAGSLPVASVKETSSSPSPGPSDGSSAQAGEQAGASQGPPPLGPSRPVRLRIPAIGVDTPVNPIGQTPDGRLAVPQPGPHLNEAAWYKQSPTPGQLGPSIIEGHVDSEQGVSVFFKLGDIKPGDKVHVTRKDGVRLVFTVQAVRDFKKKHFPTKLVYGTGLNEPSLRLITCSDFVESIHHHIGNEVVFAHLTHRSDYPHADLANSD